MKDLHCHILMGIDDGSKTIDSSLELLSQAYESGITDVMLTPHYIKGSKFAANNQQKLELLNILKKEIEQKGININLYLGNEVYIDLDILNLIKKNEIATLNNSRYILIELPFASRINDLDKILFDLINNNYIPIIAHPERYQFVQDNPDILKEYLKMGVLFQGNYKSLIGSYGKGAKKTLKILLKNRMIHFLASDIHKPTDEYKLITCKKKILKIVKDEKKVNELLQDNFDKVIRNEIISI